MSTQIDSTDTVLHPKLNSPMLQKKLTLLFAMTTFIFLFLLIICCQYQYKNVQRLSLLDVSTSLTKDQVPEVTISAELYIPTINNTLSEQWTAYANWTYEFSFLFPGTWRTMLTDNKMSIKQLTCYACAGGFRGIALEANENSERLPLEDFIHLKYSSAINAQGILEPYVSKNPRLMVLVDRYTPGGGPGETAFIADKESSKVIHLYCGDCASEELNDIVRSFDFRTDRESDSSWTKFL